jgi:hypothetical protein
LRASFKGTPWYSKISSREAVWCLVFSCINKVSGWDEERVCVYRLSVVLELGKEGFEGKFVLFVEILQWS